MKRHLIFYVTVSCVVAAMTYSYLALRLQAVRAFLDRIEANQTRILDKQGEILSLLSEGD